MEHLTPIGARTLARSLEEAIVDAARAAGSFGFLHRLAIEAARADDLDAWLGRIADAVREAFAADVARIVLADESGTGLSVRASPPPDALAGVSPISDRLATTIVGERGAVVVDESTTDAGRGRPRLPPGMYAPLTDDEQTVGFIHVTTRGHRFADADLALLQAAGAIGGASVAAVERRRAAFDRLHASEERFRLLVSAVRDYAIFALDPEGHIVSWNSGAARINGYSADEVLGRHFSIFYTETDRRREHPRKELEIAMRSGSYEEERWRVRKDGSVFWANVVITALFDEAGELVGFSKVTRDLSERKKREDARRHRELRLTHIVASAIDAIVTADENRRIVMFNEAAERLFGMAAADALGQSLDRFLPDALRVISGPRRPRSRPSRASRRRFHRRPGALRAVRADGTVFPAEASISEATVAGERLYTIVLRDATDRIAAEQASERALLDAEAAREAAEEANRTKSAFMATMSHELRTPINAVLGYTELLRMGIPDPLPESALRHVDRIQLSARHLLQLIEEVLTFARIEAGKERPHLAEVSVDEVVGEVTAIIQPFAARKGLQFATMIEQAPPAVVTDPRKLRQILLNLLGNAVKFTDSGEVELRVHSVDGSVAFQVRDTGIGIATEHVRQLFEPFWQADPSLRRTAEGTGLGLAIVQRFAGMLGGSIDVRTAEGTGSVFTLTLPVQPPPEPPPSA